MQNSTAAMTTSFQTVANKFDRRYAEYFRNGDAPSFALSGPSGEEHRLGSGAPLFTLAVTKPRALDALATLDRMAIAEAYLSDALDIEGDFVSILTHRSFLLDVHPVLSAWRFLRPRLRGQMRSDREWISQHYDIQADFFLLFLDERHRCYSHGIFESDDQSLEDAITRKLDFCLDAVAAEPGHRILDVGGGWGAFTEYAGCKDIRVTSLTISRESEKFLNDLIKRERLPCRVAYQHLYEHEPEHRYDAIVILGVTEHLPDYKRSLAKYRSLLKPGGKVYLDASAKRKKYQVSSFLERHIYPGNGSPMCLHNYLQHVAESPFQLRGVWDDQHSYALTARHWAERLDARHEEAERRWGRAQYRKFRLFLWGCYDGFTRDDLQAYRAVLELPRSIT